MAAELDMNESANRAAQGQSELQIDADLEFQARSWRAQRIGWGVCGVVLIAGVLGLFGSGLLSSTTAGTQASGLWVEYERVARLGAPSRMIVHVDRRLASEEKLRIAFAGDHVRDAQIVSLTPPAASGGVVPEGAILSFDTGDGSGELIIVFHLKFTQPGLVTGRIGMPGHQMVNMRQWVYP